MFVNNSIASFQISNITVSNRIVNTVSQLTQVLHQACFPSSFQPPHTCFFFTDICLLWVHGETWHDLLCLQLVVGSCSYMKVRNLSYNKRTCATFVLTWPRRHTETPLSAVTSNGLMETMTLPSRLKRFLWLSFKEKRQLFSSRSLTSVVFNEGRDRHLNVSDWMVQKERLALWLCNFEQAVLLFEFAVMRHQRHGLG